MEYNHCQLLLNKQELNIILQECQCSNILHVISIHTVSSLSSVFDISDISVLGFSAQQKPRKKRRELAVISLSPSEFSNTTCLSCDAAFVNRTFDYTNRSVIERSIGFDYTSFGNRTFDCVRLAKFYCEFDYVRLCSIEFGNRTIGVRLGSIAELFDWIGRAIFNFMKGELKY